MNSRFWVDIAKVHSEELSRYGFEDFKRHQNFRYFNWNFNWRSIFSRQFKFLLRNSKFIDIARALPNPKKKLNLHQSDSRMYEFAVRLLWMYARGRDSFGVTDLSEPSFGNPPEIYLHGRLISQDLANSSLELNYLLPFLQHPKKVLEIGAGYGRTAYALLSLYPECEYTIIDIEPALSISREYLTKTIPRSKINFIPASEAGGITETYDLGISISSLQEMSPETVGYYIKLFESNVRGTVYLKQREKWLNKKDNIVWNMNDLPVPPSWELLSKEDCPVQTQFVQAVWLTSTP